VASRRLGSGIIEGVLESETAPLETLNLASRALSVLESNWLGHGTRPSLLYPHQWSWDSACIAMGYACWNQTRAETELRSLFAGQWANGLVPHIVFADGDGRYFPGPDFWQASRSSDAPAAVATSGIAQPPIHATAALRLYRRSADRAAATAFLEELAPKLVAWHEYLYRERVRDGLVEIWHPWESGMDNSPIWDEALSRIDPGRDRIPDYKRVDVELADPSERPTDGEYDRYVYLVGLFRELDYRPDRIYDATPFALQSVLFNSLLVQADRDLAEIARALGEDPGPFEHWAERTAAAVDARLWSEEHGLYVDYDVRGGKPTAMTSAAGLAPLYAGIPSEARARTMVERLAGSRVELGGSLWAVTSFAPSAPGFQPTRYWRGPIWPILNWVLQRGLDRYGFSIPARQVRRALLELAGRSGFREHYSPVTGAGHGGENFAWTAGLVLDVLATEIETEKDKNDEEEGRMKTAAQDGHADGKGLLHDERRD
jgi:glycogen debranching enzyme